MRKTTLPSKFVKQTGLCSFLKIAQSSAIEHSAILKTKSARRLASFPLPFIPCAPTPFAARETSGNEAAAGALYCCHRGSSHSQISPICCLFCCGLLWVYKNRVYCKRRLTKGASLSANGRRRNRLSSGSGISDRRHRIYGRIN